jgi:hypothetical protein
MNNKFIYFLKENAWALFCGGFFPIITGHDASTWQFWTFMAPLIVLMVIKDN